jgi:hypothetical protein
LKWKRNVNKNGEEIRKKLKGIKGIKDGNQGVKDG